MPCETCSPAALREAREIVELLGSSKDKVIPFLQEIQNRHGYLPEEMIEAIAGETDIPASEIFGVATFYSQFRFTPMGKHLIKVCKGTACHVSGAEVLFSVLSEELKVEEGGTTQDKLFTLESVACLGCCSLAPVVMIDSKVYGKLTPSKVRKILRSYSNE